MNPKNILTIPLTLILLSSLSFATTYSNAEDGTVGNWRVHDNKPSGAVISNVIDEERKSHVIEFKGKRR